MKKIIFALMCAICSLLVVSCEEVSWKTDDLVETEVWTMTFNSDSAVWYFYPEYSFYITENGLTLEIISMSDWSLTEVDESKIILTLNSEMPEAEAESGVDSMRFNIAFDSATSEGIISTQFYTDGIEDTSLAQSEYIVGLEVGKKYIESRE